MGHLKDITNQPNLQTFPGAHFEIAEEVPQSQCSEALIEGDDAVTSGPPFNDLHDPGAFTGHNLIGKTCVITASVGGNTGNFTIDWNDNDYIEMLPSPGNGNPVTYYIRDGGALIVTRDVQSFADFIHAAGQAYTIKGGKLYTDIASVDLQPACSILFDPLT